MRTILSKIDTASKIYLLAFHFEVSRIGQFNHAFIHWKSFLLFNTFENINLNNESKRGVFEQKETFALEIEWLKT